MLSKLFELKQSVRKSLFTNLLLDSFVKISNKIYSLPSCNRLPQFLLLSLKATNIKA